MPLRLNDYSRTHPLHTSRHDPNPNPAGGHALKCWELTTVGPAGLHFCQSVNKITKQLIIIIYMIIINKIVIIQIYRLSCLYKRSFRFW